MVTHLYNGSYWYTGAMVTDLDYGIFRHTGAMVTNFDHGLVKYTGAMVNRYDPGLIGTSKAKIIGSHHELWIDSMVKGRPLGTWSPAICRVMVNDHGPWCHGNFPTLFRP